MSTKAKKTVGVIGGSGYTGGELIRLLINHPEISIDFVYSTTRPGTYLTDTHNDLIGQTDLQFTDEINPDVDVLFLCLGHGLSGTFLQENPMNDNTKIIDLSNEFRLQKDQHFLENPMCMAYQNIKKKPLSQRKQLRTLVALRQPFNSRFYHLPMKGFCKTMYKSMPSLEAQVQV